MDAIGASLLLIYIFFNVNQILIIMVLSFGEVLMDYFSIRKLLAELHLM